MDFHSESVLVRRKAYWEVGRFRPVPIDRSGDPAGARWVEEALAEPPAATARPVDRNSPYTALLVHEFVVFELATTTPGLIDQLIAEVVRLAGPSPLVRRSPGAAGLFYRGQPPHGSLGGASWQDDEDTAVALVIGARHAALIELDPVNEALFEWPEGRPDEVALDRLPELGDPEAVLTAVEELLRAAGYRPPRNLFDEIALEEVPPRPGGSGAPTPPGGGRGGAADPPGGPPGPEPPPPEPPDGPPPEILIRAGERPLAADRGLAALYEFSRAGPLFFNRGAELVRIVRSPGQTADGRRISVPMLRAVPLAALGRALGQAARWYRPTKGGKQYMVDVPKPIVEMVAAMADAWRFRAVRAIQRTPTLRPDFSLLAEPGYDQRTALFCDFGGLQLPRMIPAEPSRRQAETAVGLLMRSFDSFPFCDANDLATAIAAAITVVTRPAFPVVPGFAVSSAMSGSGKSYLTDCIHAIATGDRAPVISLSSKEEENEKRLVGAALAGTPVIVIDNVGRLLEGDFLCQVTERALLQLRPLGTSDVRFVQNAIVVIANGNNITYAGDLTRRFLKSNMDANCERPELRQFDGDPLRDILTHRGDYIAACLTIVRYYINAGKPNLKPRLGSYGEWSDAVRSALCHLGLADCVRTPGDLAVDDPATQRRLALFSAWANRPILALGDERGLRVTELMTEAEHDDELRQALLQIAEVSGRIDHSRLTRWLNRNVNTIAGVWKLLLDRSDASRPRWRIEPVIAGE